MKSVIERLQEWGAGGVEVLAGCEENMTFSLPKILRIRAVL